MDISMVQQSEEEITVHYVTDEEYLDILKECAEEEANRRMEIYNRKCQAEAEGWVYWEEG